MDSIPFNTKGAYTMPSSDEFERVMSLFRENILVQLTALTKNSNTLEDKINSLDRKMIKLETTIESVALREATDDRHRLATSTNWYVIFAALLGSLVAGIMVHNWK